MSMCQFKNMFGKPKEGVHSYRVFNIAIVDVILSFILAVIISWMVPVLTVPVSFLLVLILGIISHKIFCVNTTVNKTIFG